MSPWQWGCCLELGLTFWQVVASSPHGTALHQWSALILFLCGWRLTAGSLSKLCCSDVFAARALQVALFCNASGHLLWKEYKHLYDWELLYFSKAYFILKNCMTIIIIFRNTSDLRFFAALSPPFRCPCRTQEPYFIALSNTCYVWLSPVSAVLFSTLSWHLWGEWFM